MKGTNKKSVKSENRPFTLEMKGMGTNSSIGMHFVGYITNNSWGFRSNATTLIYSGCMGLKRPALFILSIILTCIALPSRCDAAIETNEFKQAILSIDKAIVDLTDPTAPLNCEQFLRLRESLNATNVNVLMDLVRGHVLTDQQEIIAVLAANYLPDETYQNATLPILRSRTNEMLLLTILDCPLPYGPACATAYKSKAHRTLMKSLLSNSEISPTIKEVVRRIFSGEASENYREFVKDPEKFSYNPKLIPKVRPADRKGISSPF